MTKKKENNENLDSETIWYDTSSKVRVSMSKDGEKVLFFVTSAETGGKTLAFGYHRNFFSKILEKKAS